MKNSIIYREFLITWELPPRFKMYNAQYVHRLLVDCVRIISKVRTKLEQLPKYYARKWDVWSIWFGDFEEWSKSDWGHYKDMSFRNGSMHSHKSFYQFTIFPPVVFTLVTIQL